MTPLENRHLASPHLQLVLARAPFSSHERERILEAYEQAMAQSGVEEIGYERPEGQSFNPRPARIALILLQDLPSVSVETVLRALSLAALGARYEGYLSDEEVPTLRAAFLLDRLRHLHKEEMPDTAKVFAAIERVSAELEESRLLLFLEKGVERMRRVLSSASL